MIRFDCKNCGKTYRIKPQYAGKKTKCTQCESALTVPDVPQQTHRENSPETETGPIFVNAELAEDSPSLKSSIEFSLGFFPLAFVFFFCTPVVVVNGSPTKLAWGRHQFEFPPGDYNIKIYFVYMWMPECGANSTSFKLDSGARRLVSFYMWPLVFAKGTIAVA